MHFGGSPHRRIDRPDSLERQYSLVLARWMLMMVANVILAVIEHRQERERRRSATHIFLVRAR